MSRFKKSAYKSGRVIGESRERPESSIEREKMHKKLHRQQISRIIVVIFIFTLIGVGLFFIGTLFVGHREDQPISSTTVYLPLSPTIPIEDQDAGGSSEHITTRMKEYIGQLEADLRELGYSPSRAVLPTGAIREIDFYLDGYSGYIKTTIDRGAGVTAEDTDRMVRYLAAQGITDFEYIDVRIDGKAYWK